MKKITIPPVVNKQGRNVKLTIDEQKDPKKVAKFSDLKKSYIEQKKKKQISYNELVQNFAQKIVEGIQTSFSLSTVSASTKVESRFVFNIPTNIQYADIVNYLTEKLEFPRTVMSSYNDTLSGAKQLVIDFANESTIRTRPVPRLPK